MESGPVAGNLFLLWRSVLFVVMFRMAFGSAKKGNYLPMLLFGAAGPIVFYGQLGQPTTLGFACFGGGMLLASLNRYPREIYTSRLAGRDKGRVDARNPRSDMTSI